MNTKESNNWVIFHCEDGSFYPEKYSGDWCPNEDTWEAVQDELIGWQAGLEDNKAIQQRISKSPEPFRIKASGVSLESEPGYNDEFGSSWPECYLDWNSVEILEYDNGLLDGGAL